MGLDQPYDKLAEGEGDYQDDPLADNAEPPPKPRFLTTSSKKPWVITGLTIAAVAIAVLLALGAVHQSSTHPATTTETAVSSPTSIATTSITPPKPAETAPVDDKVPETEEESDDIHITPPPLAEPGPHDLGDVILDCGDNFTVAREKGCVYDVMMQLWIPEPCYDGALCDRFLADGNWTWWADAAASEVISDERIKLGEHEVTYVSADYHATHCMYAWELLVRSLREQKPIIEPLISYDHAVHCRHKALKAHDSHGAIAPTRYTQCAMYKTWVNHLPENRFSSVD